MGLTGVLLVGGASERFGSPKALARFRGETLASRGERLLAIFDQNFSLFASTCLSNRIRNQGGWLGKFAFG
jgi:molybdopterin-guanine dinucleotide biosynthesis protein A